LKIKNKLINMIPEDQYPGLKVQKWFDNFQK